MRAICDHVGAPNYSSGRSKTAKRVSHVRGPKVIFDGVIILSRARQLSPGVVSAVDRGRRQTDHAKCSAILMMNALLQGSAEISARNLGPKLG